MQVGAFYNHRPYCQTCLDKKIEGAGGKLASGLLDPIFNEGTDDDGWLFQPECCVCSNPLAVNVRSDCDYLHPGARVGTVDPFASSPFGTVIKIANVPSGYGSRHRFYLVCPDDQEHKEYWSEDEIYMV